MFDHLLPVLHRFTGQLQGIVAPGQVVQVGNIVGVDASAAACSVLLHGTATLVVQTDQECFLFFQLIEEADIASKWIRSGFYGELFQVASEGSVLC